LLVVAHERGLMLAGRGTLSCRFRGLV
jgi:hypothetical protein